MNPNLMLIQQWRPWPVIIMVMLTLMLTSFII